MSAPDPARRAYFREAAQALAHRLPYKPIAVVALVMAGGMYANVRWDAEHPAPDQCVLDSIWVQGAASVHRERPGLPQVKEIEQIVVAETATTHRHVSGERIDRIQKLVEYAWTHKGDGDSPVLRDFDISMQFERDCHSGSAPLAR
jgi:hypothetical protein